MCASACLVNAKRKIPLIFILCTVTLLSIIPGLTWHLRNLRRRSPLDSFVPMDHQTRVHEVENHPQLPFDLFFQRWRCSGLRWSDLGRIEHQFDPWRSSGFNASAFEAAWLNCNSWYGHLVRAQIVDGALYVVPPPASSRAACPGYVFDELRLRALAAIIARTARYTVLPDLDMLLQLYDDPALPDGVDVIVPVFAFNRAARGGSHMLLLPLIAEPAFPFLDSERLAQQSASSGTRTDRWQRRKNKAVFRGSVTGFRKVLCAFVNANVSAARKRLLDWALVGAESRDAIASGGPTANHACHFGAPTMHMVEQAAAFNAIVLVDGNAAAWRIVRQLSLDVLTIAVRSCCETYVDLVVQTDVVSEELSEVWEVAADLSDLDAALLRLEANMSHAMATAARATSFSLSHLNDDSTMCYLAELLQRYSRLQPRVPSLHPDATLVLQA